MAFISSLLSFLLLLSLVNSQSCSAGLHARRDPRVAGGSSAGSEDFPFMAAIYRKDKFICAATLVQDRYVMTAAHCFLTAAGMVNTNVTDLTVRVNSYDLSGPLSSMVTKQVAYVIIPPTFNNSVYTTTRKSDIALLRFDTALEGIAPVKVAQTSGKLPSGEGLLLGWGASEADSHHNEVVLKRVNVKPATGGQCVTYASYVSDAHICTQDEDAGPCTGDDGAPLLFLVDDVWTIYGVVTDASGCGATGTFGVYTKVSSYYEFLYGKSMGRPDGKLYGGYLCNAYSLITVNPASMAQISGVLLPLVLMVSLFLLL